MAMKFSEVFGWLRIPFTFGETCNHGSEDGLERSGLNRESVGAVRMTTYNGQVSAVQLFLIMVVASGVQLFSSLTPDLIDRTPTRLLLVAYMTIGLVVMIGVYRERQKFLFVATIRDLTGAVRESESDDVTVAGIITFYLLGTVYDLVHITTSLSCREAWTVCRDNYFFVQDTVHVTYHVVRIVYLACQTLFCMVFNHACFLDRSLARHGLMILQAVNISLWFHEVVQGFVSDVYGNAHSKQEKANRFASMCFPNNVSNRSFDFASCLSSNATSNYYTQTYGNAILRPFNIEYSLLVGKCLARWFITCSRVTSRDSVDDPVTETRRLEEDSLTGTETRSDDEDAAAAAATVPRSHLSKTGKGRGSRRRHTEAAEEESTNVGSILSVVQTSTSRVPAYRHLTVILLVISIVANLLNAVFVFLPRIPDTFRGPLLRFESVIALAPCYSCFHYTLMIFVIAAGFHISRHFRVSRNSPFGGLDYLLLFTSSGNLAFNLFRLLGAVLSSNQTKAITSETIKAFYAGYVLLEVIETSFQVSFSLYAGRLRIREDRGIKPILFRAIILFLALCNLTTWMIQTFAVRVISQSLLVDFFGPDIGWPLVSNILKPFYLFFRFNSFLLFIRIYLRIRKQSH